MTSGGDPAGQRLPRREVLRLLTSGVAALTGVAAFPLIDCGTGAWEEAVGGSGGKRRSPVQVYYSPDYTLAGHTFATTRKARWVADSLAREPLPWLELIPPAPLAEAEVAAVHDPRYVEAVRGGEPRARAESQGFAWDPGLWPMVLASNGGAVAAARRALRDGVAGSLSSGLHHAHYDHGKGYCTFNGLVLAARAALAAGARRVLILDLDAHCGGGTHALIGDDPAIWQVDVAVNAFDSYVPVPRHTLDLVRTAGDYLPTVAVRLEELASRAPAFDLCLYNAGVDPHEDCPIGGLPGITRAILAERERLVFDWCRRLRLPVAFVLAGGYTGPALDERGLVELHRLTLAAAAG